MKLITFDGTKKITHFEEAELHCDCPEKVLNFTLIDKDPEEAITASFDNIFIQKNYILCSMAQDSSNAMIVVFPTKEECDKIYNDINEAKSHQPQSAAIDENDVFKENFYIPLIKAVQQSEDGFQDMKNIILEFVNSLDADERTYYFNVLAEFSFFVPCSTKNLQRHLRSNSEAGSTSGSEINDSTLPSRNARKRSYNNISHEEDEVGESDEEESYDQSYADEETCFDEPTPENSSSDIIFDVVEFLRHGKPQKKLLIFTSPERTHCYEFKSHLSATKYRCLQCLARKHDTVINSTIHFNGSKTYDFNINEHVCEPIVYVPENYQRSLIIKSPNFKFEKRFARGKLRPYLFIFKSGDRKMCYKFGFDRSNKIFRCNNCRRIHNTTINARYIQHEEENAIEFNRLNHLCQPKRYIP